MKKSVKNLLIGSGIAVGVAAIAAGVSHLISETLVREALDRKEPKPISLVKSQFMGHAMESDEVKQAIALGEKLGKSETTQVEVTSFDGMNLVGHLYPAKKQKRVLIAMHGWRSNWKNDFGAISEFWHDNGCTVLYVEQRGQGESEGEHMGFGMVERYDCLKWIEYLNENGFSDVPMYLVGISMGATTVLMTAGFDNLPDNIRGIIADCGFTSPQAIWKHVLEKNMKLPYYRLREKDIDMLCRQRIDLVADAYSTTEALSKTNVPVFFVHGAADNFVPVEMTYENYGVCHSSKRILIVSGADHGMSYIVNKAEYERNVLEFWKEFDNIKSDKEVKK